MKIQFKLKKNVKCVPHKSHGGCVAKQQNPLHNFYIHAQEDIRAKDMLKICIK